MTVKASFYSHFHDYYILKLIRILAGQQRMIFHGKPLGEYKAVFCVGVDAGHTEHHAIYALCGPNGKLCNVFGKVKILLLLLFLCTART